MEILSSFISLQFLPTEHTYSSTKIFSDSQLCQSGVTNEHFRGFSITIIRLFCGHKLVTHTHTHTQNHPSVVDMMLGTTGNTGTETH
jgi:hypothetical protein